MPNCPMQQWTKQTPFTDPGKSVAALAVVGPELKGAITAIQGILIHGGAVEHYGLPPKEFSRGTLAVEKRLAAVLAVDDRPLTLERAPQDRALGTCRDYAVLVCSAMRQHGRPARVRCGFASYLGGAPWEDHWICELWSDDRWLRVDAQLDRVLRDALGTRFPSTDVPPDVFLTADQAWRDCRAGCLDPAALGHGDARGLWFVFINLVRDRLALTDRLTSDWDDWRATALSSPRLSADMLAVADELARSEPTGALSLTPWWL